MRIWLFPLQGHGLSRSILSTLLMLGLLMSLSGCTRRFFRRRADAEVDEILCEKDKYPQWKLNDYYVYPHPLSRFADPTDPDRPPMPPDDPASWDLSPHPQRPWLKGYGYWQGTGYLELMRRWDIENRRAQEEAEAVEREEAEGETEPKLMGEIKTSADRSREIEQNIDAELAGPITSNDPLPVSLETVQPSANKPFLLNLAQVTELGFLNSPEFQALREQLYLTALAVTAERFAFIAQPFVTEQLIRQRAGTQVTGGPINNWVANTTAGFTKAFSTGALVLFNFANQTIYNLGKANTFSVSTINLDAIQPFLAGGGRAVVLEPLTQAERDLVYAIRQFYRFRQEYYAFFAVGQVTSFIPGVSAGVVSLLPGTVAAPAAFVPGPSALPLVANPATVQVAPQGTLGPVLNSGVLITPQGYLSAIQERTVLINTYKNIQALQRFLRIFDVWLQGGLVNLVQRGLVEQRLLGAYEAALGSQVSYRVSLDQLKQQLGLPLTVPLDVAAGPLQPMINIVEAFEKLFINHVRIITAIDQYGSWNEARQLRARLRDLLRRTPLLRGTNAQEFIQRNLPTWENFARDRAWNARRNALMNEIMKRRETLSKIRARKAENPGEKLPKEEEDRETELKFELDLIEYELANSIYEREDWKTNKELAGLPSAQQRQAREEFFGVHRIFLTVVDHAYVERLENIKKLWPNLLPIRAKGIDVIAAPQDEALLAVEQACFENRVDLMNVRSQVTDAWRKIRVAANALMGTFNVDYHLASTTPAGKALPFAFSGSRTTHQLIFSGQLPLVRILQRNNYRSTLINFQQNRRSLMEFEDQLLFNVRLELRNLRIAANTYQRVEKRQIELAYMQVDQALQAFSQPQAPPGADAILPGLVGPVGQRPQIGDPAALTNQLLGVQNSLLGAQNDLYNIWITYQIYRTDLYRDMGVMPLDNRGVWIDADATANQSPDNRPPAGQQPPANAPPHTPPPPPPPPPPNSSHLPVPSRLPKGQGWKRRGKWLIVLLGLLTASGIGLGGWYFYARKHTSRPDLVLHPIKKEKVQITITERGSLEPADNTFFSCKVKAKQQGGAATSIRWVIDNGSFVKEGDRILELDDSALLDLQTTQEIAVSQAKQLWIEADLGKTKDLLTNEALVKTNETKVEVAKFVLKEYLEGSFVQTQLDLQNKFDMSQSDLFMWKERATWSDRMSRPGRQYVTVSQAEADEARRKTAELTSKSYEKQLYVLDNLTREKFRVQYQGDIDEAQRQVDLAKETLKKTLELDNAKVDATYLQYQKQMAKLSDMQKEIDDCKIFAPRDGMVVYYVEERARFSQSSAGVIAQGEQVKEGQKLIAVPDLKLMVVNARIHEAMISRVKDDRVKYTGFSEAVNSALLFTPQPLSGLSAWIAFDLEMQSSFASKYDDVEKQLERRGLEATVRVNAFPDRALRAHVKSVAPVASQTDFFSSDVKVYQTYIAVDDSQLEGLKPGMDTVVTINVDSTPEPVLTIPLQALMGGVEMGEKRRCFVMVDGHPEMRELTLGKKNEMVAEVKEGLKEGDVVVFNPGKLLTDKEKVQYGVTTSGDEGGGSGGPGGPGGGKGGKGKGGRGGWKGGKGGAPGGEMPGGSPGMKGGGSGTPGGGGQGGGFGGGGRRSQGGAAPGGKAPANP